MKKYRSIAKAKVGDTFVDERHPNVYIVKMSKSYWMQFEKPLDHSKLAIFNQPNSKAPAPQVIRPYSMRRLKKFLYGCWPHLKKGFDLPEYYIRYVAVKGKTVPHIVTERPTYSIKLPAKEKWKHWTDSRSNPNIWRRIKRTKGGYGLGSFFFGEYDFGSWYMVPPEQTEEEYILALMKYS